MTRTISATDVRDLLADLRAQYPGFALRTKALTSTRCTTIGAVVYVPQDWGTFSPARQWVRLIHEDMHLAQFHTLGMWGFLRTYLSPSGRFALESAAFAAEFQAYADVYGVEALRARTLFYIDQLSGKAYYWAASRDAAEAFVETAMARVQAAPSA